MSLQYIQQKRNKDKIYHHQKNSLRYFLSRAHNLSAPMQKYYSNTDKEYLSKDNAIPLACIHFKDFLLWSRKNLIEMIIVL